MLTIGEQNITLTQAVIVKKKVTSVNNGLFYLKYHTPSMPGSNFCFCQDHMYT